MKPIGVKNGALVWVSESALAQTGERKIREELGLIRAWPVKTDLSGRTVMVAADSPESAVKLWLEGCRRAEGIRA
jgi:hypothetical protein